MPKPGIEPGSSLLCLLFGSQVALEDLKLLKILLMEDILHQLMYYRYTPIYRGFLPPVPPKKGGWIGDF